DDAERILGPHGAKREVELEPLLAAVNQQPDDPGTGRKSDDPAAGRTNRTIGPAADQREIRIHWRDGLSSRQEERGAAPDEQPAERDDEGRNAAVGDKPAMKGADQGSNRHADDGGDDPDCRMTESEPLRQYPDLGDPHHHGREAEKGTHRKVDVPRDDDE